MQAHRVFLILMAWAMLTACGSQTPDSTAQNDKEDAPAVPVEATTAKADSIEAFYAATATLEADAEAAVVPRVGGRITSIAVEEGDRVQAGDVLATVDSERLRLELARAEADLKRLRQDLERQREMHARDMISAEAFERLQYQFEAQEAAVELVRLELSYTRIEAPIDGVVSQRMVKVGNMVSTTEPVFRVTALDLLIATLHVPERQLARLEASQPASLVVDALPGERFTGEIDRISPVIDPESGTFRVTVAISGASERLRPGMFGRFEIVYDRRENAVLVPVESVLTEDGESSVFVVKEGQAQRRSVAVGYRNNGHFEILSGLEAGESVVVTGQASLRSGAAVKILNLESPDMGLEKAVADTQALEDLSS